MKFLLHLLIHHHCTINDYCILDNHKNCHIEYTAVVEPSDRSIRGVEYEGKSGEFSDVERIAGEHFRSENEYSDRAEMDPQEAVIS